MSVRAEGAAGGVDAHAERAALLGTEQAGAFLDAAPEAPTEIPRRHVPRSCAPCPCRPSGVSRVIDDRGRNAGELSFNSSITTQLHDPVAEGQARSRVDAARAGGSAHLGGVTRLDQVVRSPDTRWHPATSGTKPFGHAPERRSDRLRGELLELGRHQRPAAERAVRGSARPRSRQVMRPPCSGGARARCMGSPDRPTDGPVRSPPAPCIHCNKSSIFQRPYGRGRAFHHAAGHPERGLHHHVVVVAVTEIGVSDIPSLEASLNCL